MINLGIETSFWDKGVERLAGVDEAGRGPLAGPVVAAAVHFPPGFVIPGVDDSKKLSPKERERLYALIRTRASGIGVGIVSHLLIDELNILRATFRAMAEAVARISPGPQHLLVDGPAYPDGPIPSTKVIDGDALCFCIAAASIVAKVERDRIMTELDAQYPLYGFARNKGYGTPGHLEAIRRYGPCEVHRRSFRMPSRLELHA